jgi:hypothetical protein
MTATPPAQSQSSPTGQSPSQAGPQPKSKEKKKIEVDPGLATIVAAGVGLLGVVIGVVGAVVVAHVSASTASPSHAASASPSAPASVVINPPSNDKIPHQANFFGHVTNLQPGESVWTFFQVVEKGGKVNPTTYPTEGPCAINYASQTWKCDNVYVGHVKDSEMYQICPAILNSSQSSEVVKSLENSAVDSALNNKNLVYWTSSPPSYINPQSCITVTRY